jgi:hypothetical protein
MWPTGVILALLTWVLVAHASHSPVDWPAAVGVALICPAVGSVSLALGMGQRAEQHSRNDADPAEQDEG